MISKITIHHHLKKREQLNQGNINGLFRVKKLHTDVKFLSKNTSSEKMVSACVNGYWVGGVWLGNLSGTPRDMDKPVTYL